MPEAEFLETSPGQFREDIDDPHKLMLQRLEHEKHERLEALKKVEALRTRRDALAATVAGKRANMTTLEVNTVCRDAYLPSLSKVERAACQSALILNL